VPALGPEDLVLCTGTLLHASLRGLVEAAAAADFQAISLWPDDVERARAEGLTLADIRALIADHGLVVAELDPLLNWLSSGSLGPGAAAGSDAQLARDEHAFYEIAEAIGGTTLNCAHPFPGEVELDLAAERFAGVCDRAAEHGLQAAIEFLPWTGIPDVATATTIAERAGRANGGVMFDTWHHFRGTNDDEALRRVPGSRILGVQINGAPSSPRGDPMVETMHERRLPDEGDIDVAGLVRILDTIGCEAPIGVEVFSDELNALAPAEAAHRCRAATRRVLERARLPAR
jgi:sugar phosphate isomerase/epimerase